jgi:hypothetical protein
LFVAHQAGNTARRCSLEVVEKQLDLQSPDALLSLVQQLKEHYVAPPVEPKRGHPPDFSEIAWLLLAAVAVVLQNFGDRELHRLLSKDAALRAACLFPRVPHRTTIGRRLARLVATAEAAILSLGAELQAALPLDRAHTNTSALDGRMYEALGPAWHKSSRAAGLVPPGLRNVDIESSWSKSGYRGWVQGYRLILQGSVWPLPVPLFATWQPNTVGEVTAAHCALDADQLVVTEVLLGDTSFGSPDFVDAYALAGGAVFTPKQLPTLRCSWKDDLYAYRKESIELLFQRICQATGLSACPVKGYGRNGAFVLASVWLYQALLLRNHQARRPLAVIKEQIEVARWRLRE